MLTELRAACAALQEKSSDGIKAVILDFGNPGEEQPGAAETLEAARAALRAIPQPVLMVVRASLSAAACSFLTEADFTLIAHEAELCLPVSRGGDNRIGGIVAARLGYATWSAPTADLNREMERVLDMLRAKSALALRNAKASARLSSASGADTPAAQLEALRQVNQFYLANVTATQDAREGWQALLEKRPPRWQNR